MHRAVTKARNRPPCARWSGYFKGKALVSFQFLRWWVLWTVGDTAYVLQLHLLGGCPAHSGCRNLPITIHFGGDGREFLDRRGQRRRATSRRGHLPWESGTITRTRETVDGHRHQLGFLVVRLLVHHLRGDRVGTTWSTPTRTRSRHQLGHDGGSVGSSLLPADSVHRIRGSAGEAHQNSGGPLWHLRSILLEVVTTSYF